jgi:Flp pilus assembly pilin Flp
MAVKTPMEWRSTRAASPSALFFLPTRARIGTLGLSIAQPVSLEPESMKRRSNMRKSSRGAVLVEYALLLTFFAVPVIGGITAAGASLLNQYRTARAEILNPMP